MESAYSEVQLCRYVKVVWDCKCMLLFMLHNGLCIVVDGVTLSGYVGLYVEVHGRDICIE